MNKRGFTSIEIAITTIIIGLLGALGSLAVLRGVKSARITNTEAELEILGAAVLQLAWDTGRWPNGAARTSGGSVEIWNVSPASTGLMDTDGNYNNWQGPYYDANLEDAWGNNYFFDPDYRIDGQDRVVIGSFGPNGVGRNLYDADDIYVLLDD
jgi:type II secretory pathway pseudopilin PulG